MSEFAKVMTISEENYDTKSIEFRLDQDAKPGQFIMVKTKDSEEIPMSLSKTGRVKQITVKAIGDSTKKFHNLSVGDSIRIRGPYGKGYKIEPKTKYLAVGGGVGVASLLPAIKESAADVIIGVRSDKDLILEDRVKKYSKNVWISTDDGSLGFHGNAVQLMREKIKEKKYDCVLACGPPIMLKFLYEACVELGINCQLSLERFMKCGAGVCGCCVVDGQRVCCDGPVFSKKQLQKMPEFGTIYRDECGRIVRR